MYTIGHLPLFNIIVPSQLSHLAADQLPFALPCVEQTLRCPTITGCVVFLHAHYS